jgi:ribonuclease HII
VRNGEIAVAQAVRDQLIAQLEDAIKDSDQLSSTERAKLAARLQAQRGLKRFLRPGSAGRLT